jgi:hypothetical protein
MNQKILGPLFAAGIILLVIAAVMQSNFLMAGMAAALFFVIPTTGRPDLWWMVTISTMGSGLSSGLPGDAKMHIITMLGFVVLMIAKVSSFPVRSFTASRTRKACIVLLFIVVVTGSCRGWGLKILDNEYWGGMQYVSLVAALLFYIYSGHIAVSWRNFNRTLGCFFTLALLPALAVLIAYFVPHGELIRNIIDIGEEALEATGAYWQAPDVTRWTYLQYPAIWMGVLAIVLYDRKFAFSPAVIFIASFSFLLLGFSGHRTIVVLLGLTMLIYVGIRRRSVRMSQYVKLLGALVLLVAVIYLFVEHLPLAFQRAFAWLPGIKVTYAAGYDAMATSDWRIEMWKQLIPMIPDYLWVGRGLAFSVSDLNATANLASDRATMHLSFIAVHLYHNGPLWFLIDLGIFGLISGVIFMGGGVVHYGRKMRDLTEGSRWKSIYVVFYSFFTGYCIFFFAVIGGGSFLCHILVVASILEVILRSAEAEQERSKMTALEANSV